MRNPCGSLAPAVVLAMLLGVALAGGCAPKSPAPGGAARPGGPEPFALFAPCGEQDAAELEILAKSEPQAALRGASCLAFLVEHAGPGAGASERLALARRGRELAGAGAAAWPQSGVAHYLLAYLTGLVAENDPLRGLSYVPVIEAEAARAAALGPGVHFGGPDRMLGELYLKAPEPPVSVGDTDKSVAHYNRAVETAPGYLPNRTGLARALLAANEPAEACAALHQAFAALPPAESEKGAWNQAVDILGRLCEPGNFK